MPTKVEKDTVVGTETTGHEWDGIKELDNPIPRWWLYVFYATVLWSVAYYVFYPAIPWISGHTTGLLNHTERSRVVQDLADANASKTGFIGRIEKANLQDIRSDQELLNFAIAGGRAAFADNCAPCHGTGAIGGPGYPNLADDDWLWGGKLEDIYTTLKHGIRWAGDDNTRISDMPKFGADGLLKREQISDVTEHVLSLTGQSTDPAAAKRGGVVFTEQCAACHGEQGGGNIELGAPKLNDAIWFYGSDKAILTAQIANPKQGVMPAWQGRLDDTTLKMLSVYVHSMGGGQ